MQKTTGVCVCFEVFCASELGLVSLKLDAAITSALIEHWV